MEIGTYFGNLLLLLNNGSITVHSRSRFLHYQKKISFLVIRKSQPALKDRIALSKVGLDGLKKNNHHLHYLGCI